LGDADHVAFLRRQRNEAEPGNDPVAERPSELVRRVSGASLEEIDRVIRELECVREMLRTEGERVSREIASFATLNHSATTAMKVIADSLKQWKETPLRS
jgi:IS30 family transposase